MKPSFFVPCTLLAAVMMAQPSYAFLDKVVGTGGTKTEDTSKKSTEEYKGVKHAIGVRDFENQAGWSGQVNLGESLGVMLESALYDTGRFVVVTRDKLEGVIEEQNLAASGRASKGADVAQTGKLRSAKFIATGAITTVEGNTSGNDGGVRVGGFRVGGGNNKATITAVITLIDTTTGEIVAKERVTGKAGGRSINLGYAGSGFGGDLGGFAKEPIGEAAQDVVSQAVDLMVKSMKNEKLDGSVVMVSGEKVIINRGTQYGIEPGHSFLVRTKGEVLTDPDTGEVLDRMEGEVICTLTVDSVKEKIAYCKVVEGDLPDRGATVIMK